jgi:hypothetical protein
MLSELMASARREVTTGDPSLAVYMVRDLDVTKRLGLTDLAWALCHDCTRAEAVELLDRIESAIREARAP